ncbi:MarR family transcriptional regulator [Paracoccus sp. MBLB3053]|uniref:MarR family transcriptional regulator n=1 Tax=Paracoccus aurantius TaxID=3073814 RepID=A0ABU2HU53_9RHOB|nr:MarR family transcriptional regulator [Paracoccus sp. MBLB3053]MDS9468580.1 MarR family transcriptional regulator [Paracoccus sp. MBLB3053]
MNEKSSEIDQTVLQRAPEKDAKDVADIVSASILLQIRFTDRLKEADPNVTATQWAMLNLLTNHGPLRPFHIARKLGISRQHTFQATRKLQSYGYIASTSEDNSRAVTLTLTDDGKKLHHAVAKLFDAAAGELNVTLPKANVRPTKVFLLHLTRTLSDADPGDDAERLPSAIE